MSYHQTGDPSATGAAKPPTRNAALPAGATFADVTLESAAAALAGPLPLGPHPEDGEAVKLHSSGRFGPYLQHRTLLASIPKVRAARRGGGRNRGRSADAGLCCWGWTLVGFTTARRCARHSGEAAAAAAAGQWGVSAAHFLLPGHAECACGISAGLGLVNEYVDP